MEIAVLGRVAVLAGALMAAWPAGAIIVGGGGSKHADCLVVFDAPANYPIDDPKQVRCVDGDASCDSDLTVNGVCSVRIKICVNSTANSECTLSDVAQINVDHAADNGDPKFDPDFLAVRSRIEDAFMFPVSTADSCTGTVTLTVPIKGPLAHNACGRRKKKLTLRSVSTGAAGAIPDTDTLKIYCMPALPPGDDHICDPQLLFGSTFDRIQRQIFNQSCAVSSCHDSQSQTGGLLLETGAAYGNLIDHVATKAAAQAAGWPRVNTMAPTPVENLETSFLWHKIEGDLPDDSFGVRMPRDRPKLNGTLREIIRLWIEAGAPSSGWVDGTF